MGKIEEGMGERCKLVLVAVLLLSVVPVVQGLEPMRGGGSVVPGQWYLSPDQTSCGTNKVCADWIEDEGSFVGSCCVDPSVVGTDDVTICPAVFSHYLQ